MLLKPFLKDGKTYTLFMEGKRDSLLIRMNVPMDKIMGANWRGRVNDDEQVMVLDKPKMRTMYVPYQSIRHVEESKLSEAEALFS